MQEIIIALLPLITKLGLWWIETFISGEADKQKKREAFLKWVDTHKKDGNTSANQHQSYQDQLNDLEKDRNDPPNPQS